ncbi:MAG: calcineurin-like phosphoesterase C-terminal domain-containing protein, partial [Muribaculaceae bacterium]|nr:calcineurin-like phosphoesterase C-terminal domain-containing protein [Muribaculaceae bacterium]
MKNLIKFAASIATFVTFAISANADTYLNENFSWLSYGSELGWTTSGEKGISNWTAEEKAHGWTSRTSYVYGRQGFVKLSKLGYGGDIITPTLNISGTKTVTLSFQATGFTSSTLSAIDAQELYVVALGAGTVVNVTGGVGGNSVNGGETHYIANNVAYVDENGNNITLHNAAYIKLDSANHFNKQVDATGTKIWKKGFTHYSVTVQGATAATRIAFIAGNYNLNDGTDYRNRIFLDNIVVEDYNPTYVSEGFSWLSYGSELGWTTTGEKGINNWTAEEKAHGWTSRTSYAYGRQGFVKLGKTGCAGDIISPTLDIQGTAAITVAFQATGFTSGALAYIDPQQLYVAALGAGKVINVEGGVGSNSENGGEVHFVKNNVAYIDENGDRITLNDVAYINLDSANHFNKQVDATGKKIWNKGFTKYTVTIEGATSATRIAFIGGDFNLSDGEEYRNRIFLDNIVIKNYDVAAPNIIGRITCKSTGVSGVPVSDGILTTVTDDNGYYSLRSHKKNGSVFYTLPRGYEPDVANGFNPQFWAKLTADVNTVEEHNFEITDVDNDNYIMVVGADAHLSNRINDISQFSDGFVEHLRNEVTEAGVKPIYSTILGDLAWDRYWYGQNYDLSSFMSTLVSENYPMILFPVMGNHDNDASVAAGTSCDFNAGAAWRNNVCPNHYSYNIGQVHYVVLDDVIYLNNDTGGTYDTGVVGSRDYNRQLTIEQFIWLKKDLELVDKSTPVIIELHVPVWKLKPSDFSVGEGLVNGGVNSSVLLSEALKDFQTVHIWTGHTHYNYHSHPTAYPNIHENNVAGICGTWWWTGYYTDRHICKDGTPGGYEVVYVDGKDIKWEYHSMENNGNAQFRAFDMNKVRSFYSSNSYLKTYFENNPSKMNYASSTYDNYANSVLLNIFNYDTDWKVEAEEIGSNGKATTLKPVRVAAEDPLHTIAYTLERLKRDLSLSSDFQSYKNAHMFRIPTSSATTTVNIRVTDSFGNVYTKEFKRPSEFSINMKDETEKIPSTTSVAAVSDGNNVKVLTGDNSIIIKSDIDTEARIYTVSGSLLKSIKVNRGLNEYPVEGHGFYVVSIGGAGHKVVL